MEQRSLMIYVALYLKQIAISSLLYCNILTQGLSSPFFLFFYLDYDFAIYRGLGWSNLCS